MVAINKDDGTIENFKAISNADTKGIGSKITESAFADSVIGKNASDTLDTISGATLTSTPVVQAINDCAVAATLVE
jgi:electron transport complex protein RnfG